MNFLTRHRSKIFTWIGVGATVAAGVLSGGVFTLPVLVTAIGSFFSKLAATPLNHDAERQADVMARLEKIKNRGEDE